MNLYTIADYTPDEDASNLLRWCGWRVLWLKSWIFVVTTRDASGISERMRITSAGNVGIGTTNPTSTLQIAGTFRLQREEMYPLIPPAISLFSYNGQWSKQFLLISEPVFAISHLVMRFYTPHFMPKVTGKRARNASRIAVKLPKLRNS